MSCIDNTVSVVDSKIDMGNERMLVLVSESKAINTSISAMQASLHTSNSMAHSIKQDLHTALPQKEDIRDLTTATQRTMDLVVAGSEKADIQHHSVTTKLDMLLRMHGVLDSQSGNKLNEGQLVCHSTPLACIGQH